MSQSRSVAVHALIFTVSLAGAGLAAEKTKADEKPAPVNPAMDVPQDPFKALTFRNIGPAIMGGRIDDFAVVESDPSTFYVATASGGVWKTINNGITFEPVFDDREVSSIGDVTVAPSDPLVIWIGTGEPNNRQSSSWGNGVYRSLDGGKSWTQAGLTETHHIGRIAVHPANPDVAYIAALGSLWAPSKERGLFKTTDGGHNWVNTKFIDDDTGFVDLAMDPVSPNTLYAASYQRRRTPFGYNGGGPGSGLWKTIDGGATWKRLTKGLPTEGPLGRIGLAIYRKEPRIVYAVIEHLKESGVYRSEDWGESWAKMSAISPRPSYYSKIQVDPNNDLRIWMLGAPMYYSEDGGKTFKIDRIQKIHSDYHGLWIDPKDSRHMLVGTDGGIYMTYDGGRSMDFVNIVALAQFYEVHFDMQQPYQICGGLQDNGSWCGPSRTLFRQGIANQDWFRVGGGDGFYTVIDPSDPDIVYVESQDGSVQRFDRSTNERRTIRPEPPEGERYRFNWNSPILISPHDPKTIYYGGNRLFGSTDRGETWSLVTADLTTNTPRDGLAILGKTSKDFLSRNDGVVHWGTITTIAESPIKPGVLWVGTDDGKVQVSKDSGTTWTDLTPRITGVPKGTYVSRVEASRTGDSAAYVAFDGHRAGDFMPYVFRTADFGLTWKAIAAGLPKGGTVSVVREHPRNGQVLLVGTERALFVSWNQGASWNRLKTNLPTVPVDDIQIHPRDNDLILATHGRGIFILDDATPLVQTPGGKLDKELELFEIRPAMQYRIYGHTADTGHKVFLGPNPPDGALITYYLKSKLDDKATVEIAITAADGTVVRELAGSKDVGFNRTNWDLRHEPPIQPEPDAPSFFGPPRGPLVPPGTYTVTVTVGPLSASRTVLVEEDPRIRIGDSERRVWYEFCLASSRLWGRADTLTKALTSLKKQATDLQEALKKGNAAAAGKSANRDNTDELLKAVQAFLDAVEPMAKRIDRWDPSGFAGAPLAEEPIPLLGRVRGLNMAVNSITAAPTPQQKELLPRLEKELDDIAAATAMLTQKNLLELNRILLEGGRGRIETPKLPKS